MTQNPPQEEESQSTSVRGEPSEVNHPIFIVGCHRSGTSVLRQSLDSHPRISAGPEDPTLFWLSKTDTDLTRERREGYGFAEEEWFALVRDLVEKVHGRYADDQGKTRWAMKHPEATLVVDYLGRVFPDCQVIHIVRHPRDVLDSSRRKFGETKGPFYGKRWADYVRAAEDAGERLGKDRFRTIRYEDLVANPESELRKLVAWLGEPWSDEILHIDAHTHRYPASTVWPEGSDVKSNIHPNSVGRGDVKANFVPLVYVRLKANDLLKKFGYRIRFVNR
jgi:Sulfotransferase family